MAGIGGGVLLYDLGFVSRSLRPARSYGRESGDAPNPQAATAYSRRP
jgi:hypothetical protein